MSGAGSWQTWFLPSWSSQSHGTDNIITNKISLLLNRDDGADAILEGDVGAQDRTHHLGYLPAPVMLAGVWHF